METHQRLEKSYITIVSVFNLIKFCVGWTLYCISPNKWTAVCLL